MRFGPDDPFWLAVDPGPESEEDDCVFETSLRKLDLQFKGGLTMDRNPTIFTDENEARVEAFCRMTAMRASATIRDRLRSGEDVDLPLKIEVHGASGEILFRATISSSVKPFGIPESDQVRGAIMSSERSLGVIREKRRKRRMRVTDPCIVAIELRA